MKKIKDKQVNVGANNINVTIFQIEKEDILENVSRIYIVAINSDNKVPLIYNSKRDIWGFPGGNIEEGETLEKAALRESVEEIKMSIKDIENKYMLINKIDDDKEEKQIICFAKVGEENTEFKDKNESVKQVIYVPVNDIISKIGNESLWDIIINEFKNWII